MVKRVVSYTYISVIHIYYAHQIDASLLVYAFNGRVVGILNWFLFCFATDKFLYSQRPTENLHILTSNGKMMSPLLFNLQPIRLTISACCS